MSYQEILVKLKHNVEAYRAVVGRPLTLQEKILVGHLKTIPTDELYGDLELKPDRVGLQNATAQMAVLQFINAGKQQVMTPTAVICDHLVEGSDEGAEADLIRSATVNKEPDDFLRSAAEKYGMAFWPAGTGIIHSIMLEYYVVPGSLVITTDSHGPNAGGVGMGIGVGGADAADVMMDFPFVTPNPKKFGVHLTGKLSGWASPKDVILKVLKQITTQGGKGYILEYFGEGATTIPVLGRSAICNMGAEHGATTSIFGYDEQTDAFLRATGRGEDADVAHKNQYMLAGDAEVYANPNKYFDKVITIDLSKLSPAIAGPYTPDLVRPVSELRTEIVEKQYPDLSAVSIGSCTNSSLSDMKKVAIVVQQAVDCGCELKVPTYVAPGSEAIKRQMDKEGITALFEKAGIVILTNACGHCIGMWDRKNEDVKPNSIVTSFNRNFGKRNDGHQETHGFLTSPEISIAIAFGGFNFDPTRDKLVGSDGQEFMLTMPLVNELPEVGFDMSNLPEEVPHPDTEVIIVEGSDRIQLLEPFSAWDGDDFVSLPVLIKTKGKNTTDHISAAGKWLKYRGHLPNISQNMMLTSKNAFTGKEGVQYNGTMISPYDAALHYKEQGQLWCIIGDEDDGEGSSREHAAMEPRYMGCAFKLVKSFARIHEANLKKQGVLALTFANFDDYDLIQEGDTVSIVGLSDIKPNVGLTAIISQADGREKPITVFHSYSAEEIEWFKAGSALNHLANLA